MFSSFKEFLYEFGFVALLLVFGFAVLIAGISHDLREQRTSTVICDGGWKYRQSMETGIKTIVRQGPPHAQKPVRCDN